MNQRTYGYTFLKYGDPMEVTVMDIEEIANYFQPDQEPNQLDELLKDSYGADVV